MIQLSYQEVMGDLLVMMMIWSKLRMTLIWRQWIIWH